MTALLPTPSDGQLVGAVIFLAMLSPTLLLLPRLVRAWRDWRRVVAEWDALTETVEALRADIDRDSEPLLDRIARDELAGFFAGWSALLAEEGRRRG